MPSPTAATCLASVLALFSVQPLTAAPMVTFERLPGNTRGALDWPDLKKMVFTTTAAGGIGPLFYFNASDATYLDFHFVFRDQGTEATGNGGPFFKDVKGTRTSLDFTQGTGTGIRTKSSAEREVFQITGTGFQANITVEAQPTVPEPSSLALVGLGLSFAGATVLWRRVRPKTSRAVRL